MGCIDKQIESHIQLDQRLKQGGILLVRGRRFEFSILWFIFCRLKFWVSAGFAGRAGMQASALREEATKVLWLPLHRHSHGDAAAAGGLLPVKPAKVLWLPLH